MLARVSSYVFPFQNPPIPRNPELSTTTRFGGLLIGGRNPSQASDASDAKAIVSNPPLSVAIPSDAEELTRTSSWPSVATTEPDDREPPLTPVSLAKSHGLKIRDFAYEKPQGVPFVPPLSESKHDSEAEVELSFDKPSKPRIWNWSADVARASSSGASSQGSDVEATWSPGKVLVHRTPSPSFAFFSAESSQVSYEESGQTVADSQLTETQGGRFEPSQSFSIGEDDTPQPTQSHNHSPPPTKRKREPSDLQVTLTPADDLSHPISQEQTFTTLRRPMKRSKRLEEQAK